MSEQDRDDDLRLTEQLGELYRSSSTDVPPPELDRRILAAAAAAAEARHRRRWPLASLGTAAAAVLAVVLLLPLITEPPLRPDAASRAAVPAPEARRPSPLRLPESVEEVVVTGNLVRERGDTAQDEPARLEAPPPYPASDAADVAAEAGVIETDASAAGEAAAGAAAAANPDAAPQPASRQLAAKAASARYADPACPEPHALPANATIRSLTDGIRVEAGGEAYTLRCIDGEWQRERAPQPDR